MASRDWEQLGFLAACVWVSLTVVVLTGLFIAGEWTAAEVALGAAFALPFAIGFVVAAKLLWDEWRKAWRKEVR